MSEQLNIIKTFCRDANFHMVKFEQKDKDDFGKILDNNELLEMNLTSHEIHRSIYNKDGSTLFAFNLLPEEKNQYSNNPLHLLIKNLEDARTIEEVYPNIFKWAFDGLSVKAYAVIASNDFKSNSTLTRYGGTKMFIRILRQHLKNISKLKKGMTPDYNFLNQREKIEETELSIGAINMFNKMYSVAISLNDTYLNILNSSKQNNHNWTRLNKLDMKYWAKEINPDFISEAKHISLEKTFPLKLGLKHFPPCIKNLTNLKNKGNFNRFLLTRFLLSIYKPRDAKFVYSTVLANEELEHIRQGNCNTQWNYIRNNIERYSCPTCQNMKSFCDKECPLSHPLEKIQEIIEENE